MIICRIFQSIISSHVDAEAALPDWVQNHFHNCAACRQYYAAARRLAQLISASAEKQRRFASPFLHAKIMAAVHSQADIQAQPQRALGWAIMAGATSLMVAALIWWRQSPAPAPSASAEVPTAPALNVNLPTLAQVGQWTKTLDTPLERETQLVLSDANAALNSLAKNFLPDDLLQSSASNAQH